MQRGWRAGLADSITNTRKKTEADIAKTCARHYFEFLSAVRELVEMRGSAEELSALVSEVNKEFSSAGEDLLRQLNALELKRQQSESNAKALEIVHHCKELASLIVKAQEHITNQSYYAAIACVDTLRTEMNNPLSAPILAHLKQKLPKLSNQLLSASRNDMLTWFSYFREKNQLIGSTILRKCAAHVLVRQLR